MVEAVSDKSTFLDDPDIILFEGARRILTVYIDGAYRDIENVKLISIEREDFKSMHNSENVYFQIGLSVLNGYLRVLVVIYSLALTH